MDTITTTNLRTQSSELIDALNKGESISLIHRSKIVGIIKPSKEPKILSKSDIAKLKQLAIKLNLPKTSYEKREKSYKEYIDTKYGKNLS